jgi:hypothetical protein
MGAPIKYEGGMSLEAIAAAEGTTPAAIHMLLSRALRKLRSSQGSICSARELLDAVERNRPHTQHTVRRVRGR